MKPNVLCTAPFSSFKSAINILEKNSNLTLMEYAPYDVVENVISEIHGFIPNARIKVDRNLLEKAKNLRVIYQPSLGRDHIDERACNDLGILLRGLSDENKFREKLWTTAEHTIGLILNLLKKQHSSINSVLNNGNWKNTDHIGFDLRDKKVGIVGFGNVGSKVGYFLDCFGAKVFKYDQYIKQDNSFLSLDEIFEFCDIISLHVPLTPETNKMIKYSHLKKLSKGWIINTSRGSVIDEKDLIKSLKENILNGAALDVIEKESVFGVNHSQIVNYAKSVNNVIITPHLGGSTIEYLERIFNFSSSKLIKMLAN